MKSTISIILFATATIVFAFTSGKKPSAKNAKKVLDGFCQYVPSGKAVVGGDTVSVQSFYMSTTEITNFQYLEFLYHLKRNKELDKLKLAQIDSTKWLNSMGYGEAYVKHYHNHSAYHSFPVVNVSKKGAEMYCEWLTEVYDSISGGELKLQFRIPTRAEYMRAARGDNHSKVYTWEGIRITKSDGKPVFHGQIQANCLSNGAECIRRNPETGKLEFIMADYRDEYFYADNADVTAPAKSYWPNDFGFYNINGNVEEMISDSDHAVGGGWKSPGYDIRNESIQPFKEASSTVGFRVIATYIEPIK